MAKRRKPRVPRGWTAEGRKKKSSWTNQDTVLVHRELFGGTRDGRHLFQALIVTMINIYKGLGMTREQYKEEQLFLCKRMRGAVPHPKPPLPRDPSADFQEEAARVGDILGALPRGDSAPGQLLKPLIDVTFSGICGVMIRDRISAGVFRRTVDEWWDHVPARAFAD